MDPILEPKLIWKCLAWPGLKQKSFPRSLQNIETVFWGTKRESLRWVAQGGRIRGSFSFPSTRIARELLCREEVHQPMASLTCANHFINALAGL